MNIELFEEPTRHPYGMLDGLGLKNTMECESVLAWTLRQCVEAGAFIGVETKYSHPLLVTAGLLERVAPRKYLLTKKAKGYLYIHYGRD